MIWGILLAILCFEVYMFIEKRWQLQQLNIPDLSMFPFFIEIFYPIVKLAIVSAEERFKILAGFSWDNPDMMKLWMGHQMVVFVNSPDRIKKILLSPRCQDKWSKVYDLMQRSNGLIAATTKKWKDPHKLFNHLFKAKAIESLVPAFAEFSDVLCADIVKEVGQQEFDFFEYTKRFCFDVVCSTVIGIDVNDQSTRAYRDTILEAFEM